MSTLLALLFGYLVGSLPVVYLLARARGVDLRSSGTGNVGGGNLWRQAGPRVGLLGILVDIGKGAVPPLALGLLGADRIDQVAGALAAVAGQMWPFLLRFQGGRGNVTGVGALFALSPVALLLGFSVFLLTVAPKVARLFLRRRMESPSLGVPFGAILAMASYVFFALLLRDGTAAIAGAAIVALLLLRRATAPWPPDPRTGLPPRRSLVALLLFDRPTLPAPGRGAAP